MKRQYYVQIDIPQLSDAIKGRNIGRNYHAISLYFPKSGLKSIDLEDYKHIFKHRNRHFDYGKIKI